MELALVGICWLLTTDCNLNCPMCYGYRLDSVNLGLDTKRRIADRIAAMDVRKVMFSGGEPLLDPDLPHLVKHLHTLGVKTGLSTNGELVTPKVLGELSPYLDEITIPVEGSTLNIHGRVRPPGQNFEVSMRLLKELKSYPIVADISTVVTRHNLADLPNIREIVRCSQVPKWKVFQFYPLEAGALNRETLAVSKKQFVEACAQLAEESAPFEIDFRVADERVMRSYLHISPGGRMLIVSQDRYSDIGHFLDTEDILLCLNQNDFPFDIHLQRHRRDRVNCSTG